MKLKAPPGVGDPCVAGAAISSRDGIYDVEDSVGALLIECFGFVAAETAETALGSGAAMRSPRTAAKPRRRLSGEKN
jgi:hypothetical protein